MRIKQHKTIFQFLEYMLSGGVYFWSGYGVFALLWSGLRWNLWWSTIVSNLVGWTLNYILQRYWVFKNDELKHQQTQVTNRYIFITLVDFVLNYFILYGLRAIGISPYIGQFISSGFFTGWNYAWYRFWVFPDKVDIAKTKLSIAHLFAHRPHGHSAFTRPFVK